jgi:hypothetical protein
MGGDSFVLASDPARDRLRGALGLPADERARVFALVMSSLVVGHGNSLRPPTMPAHARPITNTTQVTRHVLVSGAAPDGFG